MSQGPLDLRDYLAVLWRRKWAIALVTVTTAGVALFLSYRQTPVYTSAAEVLVLPARFAPTQPSAEFGFTNMNTEQTVANSAAVAQIALRDLARRGLSAGTISAVNLQSTETIQFTSTTPDPAAAKSTAQAYADAYLQFRLQSVLDDLQAAVQPIKARLASVDKQLRATEAELKATSSPARTSLLTAQYSGLLSRQTTLIGNLNEFPSPSDVHVGSILQAAQLPLSPSAPNHKSAGILGFLVGVVLGISVAFFRDRLDQGVRGREDLELHSGAPILAYVPRIPSSNGVPILLAEPDSAGAEAYKTLRVRLTHAAALQGLKSIVVTSSVEGEGKTFTTANLGIALAQSGKRVIIVSADLRRPRLQEFIQGRNGTGLKDVLTGKKGAAEAVSSTDIANLWVMQAGSELTSSAELDQLGSALMKEVLAGLSGFDVILIDTPPLLAVSDAAELATLADGVLFVADPRRVQTPIVEQARLELELVGARIIGVVVNNFDSRQFRPYSTRYRYYSKYASNEEAQKALTPIRQGREEQPPEGE
jgi:polysaccharide biosynthesis transport protein